MANADVVLMIPGSNSISFSGGVLSDPVSTNAIADTTSASIVAYGMPFTLGVNNVGVTAGTLGFSLTYAQVACGTTGA